MTTGLAIPQVEPTADSVMQVRRARQGLIVFAGCLNPLSLFGYWFYLIMGDTMPILPSLPLALAPGLASVFTRLLRHEGFADVSFRWRGNRMRSAFLLAFVLPLVVGAVAFGLAYIIGLARFDPPAFPFPVRPPLVQFGINLVFSAILMILILPATGGEEIGWRGYMLLRMIEGSIPQPVIVSSLVWGAWHLPVVFGGVYAAGPSRIMTAIGLMLGTLALGSILAWLRLSTGSIWPCIFAHAAWNSLINSGFTAATQNAAENLWIGETGILVAVALVIAALLLRRSWSPNGQVNE